MRAAFRTLGCKVNQVETEALLGFLKALEPEVVPLEAGGGPRGHQLLRRHHHGGGGHPQGGAPGEAVQPPRLHRGHGVLRRARPEVLKELGADAVVPNARKAELPRVILERFGLPSDPITTPPNEFWGAGERGF